MRAAPASRFSDQDVPLWRRSLALALSIAITALMILLLLGISSGVLRKPQGNRGVLSFSLAPEPSPTRTATSKAKARPAGASRPIRTASPKTAPTPKSEVDTSHSPLASLNVLNITGADLARVDKAMTTHNAPTRTAQADDGSGDDHGHGDSRPASTAGPGGEPMYDPDWYQRPTDSQLAFYLPKDRPTSGWGLIACRTAPGYRVEDCQELGESPPGSRLASAVRQAAWQFKVLPPRVGGKPLLGVWVRIRIDYTLDRASAR